jgi:hypothetical protein
MILYDSFDLCDFSTIRIQQTIKNHTNHTNQKKIIVSEAQDFFTEFCVLNIEKHGSKIRHIKI